MGPTRECPDSSELVVCRSALDAHGLRILGRAGKYKGGRLTKGALHLHSHRGVTVLSENLPGWLLKATCAPNLLLAVL